MIIIEVNQTIIEPDLIHGRGLHASIRLGWGLYYIGKSVKDCEMCTGTEVRRDKLSHSITCI